MDNVPFTIEEENLICIYHKYDRRRTIAAISDVLDVYKRQYCKRIVSFRQGDGRPARKEVRR